MLLGLRIGTALLGIRICKYAFENWELKPRYYGLGSVITLYSILQFEFGFGIRNRKHIITGYNMEQKFSIGIHNVTDSDLEWCFLVRSRGRVVTDSELKLCI